MEGAFFSCPPSWEAALPPGIRHPRLAAGLAWRSWDLVALTPGGVRRLGRRPVRCRTLLAPGDCPPALLRRVRAQQVISYGLSPRDSLTLSSLRQPVLCVQRTLLRPDGRAIEPQEFPLPELPGAPEELLPLLGVRLLHMPMP